MNSSQSSTLRYLLSKGHKLCEDIKDYTEAQIFFMLLADEKEINDKILPEKSFLNISSNDSAEEIKRKFSIWTGKKYDNDKKTTA